MKKLKIKDILYFLIGFVVLFLGPTLFVEFRDYQRKENLKACIYNCGIITDKFTGVRGGKRIQITHFLDGKTILSERYDPEKCFNRVKIKDTVFIKYSIENPKIVELQSCRWDRDKYGKYIGKKVGKKLEE